MKKTRGFLLAASVVFALAFTFSCSSDPDDASGTSSSSGGGNGGSSSSVGGDGYTGSYGSVTDNAGKSYKTVIIGTQTWMAENLDYEAEGSKCYGEGGEVIIDIDENHNPITRTLSPAEVQDNCAIYGRLYDWSTAMGIDASFNSTEWGGSDVKHRGICPSGWHIPSNAEWTTLTDYVVGEVTAGTKLKAASGWNDCDGTSGNGTDDYGFSALPGGGYSDGSFGYVGNTGRWWSSSEYDSEYDSSSARGRRMYCNFAHVGMSTLDKSNLYSVRCVKD